MDEPDELSSPLSIRIGVRDLGRIRTLERETPFPRALLLRQLIRIGLARAEEDVSCLVERA